jgi:hypothetical protein
LAAENVRQLAELLCCVLAEGLHAEAAALHTQGVELIPELAHLPPPPPPPPPPAVPPQAPAAPHAPASAPMQLTLQQYAVAQAEACRRLPESIRAYRASGHEPTPQALQLLQSAVMQAVLGEMLAARAAQAATAASLPPPVPSPSPSPGPAAAQPETGESSPFTDIGPPSTLPTAAELALQERALQSLKATHAFLKTTPWLSARGRSAAMQAACTTAENALLLLRRLHNSLCRGDDAYLSRSEALKACDELVKAQRKLSKAPNGPPAAVPAEAEGEPGTGAAEGVREAPARGGGSPEPEEGCSPRKRPRSNAELPCAAAEASAGLRVSPRKRLKSATAAVGAAAPVDQAAAVMVPHPAGQAAPLPIGPGPAAEEGAPAEAMAVDAVLSAVVEQVAVLERRHGEEPVDTAAPLASGTSLAAFAEEEAAETMAVDDGVLLAAGVEDMPAGEATEALNDGDTTEVAGAVSPAADVLATSSTSSGETS